MFDHKSKQVQPKHVENNKSLKTHYADNTLV